MTAVSSGASPDATFHIDEVEGDDPAAGGTAGRVAAAAPPPRSGVGWVASSLSAAYSYASLTATAVPGLLLRQLGVTKNFLHWNTIEDWLILGALMVHSTYMGRGNHLEKLRKQLEARPSSSPREMGLVVSCLTPEENNGFGMTHSIVEFVTPNLWEAAFPGVRVLQLPLVDRQATVAGTNESVHTDALFHVVDTMHECRRAGKVCYVHCKAGKGRSWMIVMCYLVTYGGMSYPLAERLVAERRQQVSPSSSQRARVMEFAEAFLGRAR